MSLTMLRTGFLGLALACAGLCQPERFLDVTKLQSPQGGGSLSVGMGTHQPPPKTSPLRITLLSLDKDLYYWGEKLIAEARIENSGDEPIAFPATLNSLMRKPLVTGPSGPRGLSATVRPVAEPDPSRSKTTVNDGTMSSPTLHGATNQPNTVILLQPHETLRVRFPSNVSPYGQSHDRFPLQLTIRAEVLFYEGPLSLNYRPAISENAITITVRAKP